MDTNITDAIDAAVFAQREQEHLFTAYDITVIVRRDGHWLEHPDCREYVRRMYDNNEMTGYDQALVTLDTGNQAYVYFPAGSNPDTYISAYTNVKAQNFGVSTAAHPTGYFPQQNSVAPSNSGRKGFDGIKNLDGKGRLLVPAKIIRDAGFEANDFVCVDIDPTIGVLTISNSGPVNRTIDRYCNLRIGLRQAGVKVQSYTFSVVNPHLVKAVPA